MHDINPLGSIYHLKELERQASPRLCQLRTTDRRGPTVMVAGLFTFLGLASIWLV